MRYNFVGDIMNYVYKTRGTCSTEIHFEINGDIITNIKFVGGCPGNLQAISKLLDGQSVDYIVSKLKGNKCGFRQTSCADQLALAVLEASGKGNSNE